MGPYREHWELRSPDYERLLGVFPGRQQAEDARAAHYAGADDSEVWLVVEVRCHADGRIERYSPEQEAGPIGDLPVRQSA